MIELLKILLSLSLSGALLILVLLLCKPLYKNRLSRQWQYYIWLIVIARLLLPFTPETSLVGNLFLEVDSAIVQTSTSGLTDSRLSPETDLAENDTPPKNQADMTSEESPEPEKTLLQRVLETASQNIWLICVLVWLMVSVGLLIRKVTIYQSFVKYINAGRMEVTDIRLWEQLGKLVEQAGVKGTVELYTNSLISSPLLIGFLHPCIMLPSTELSDSDLKNTILHELTHYKRRDMFYKWLVQVAICFHWFNPLVYLMGLEVSRVCELSCDEAVIKSLDEEGRRAYGDTLLNAIGTGGTYKNSLASVTLSENAELLKERLDAIMKLKNHGKAFVIISALLAILIFIGGFTLGAYSTKPAWERTTPGQTRQPSADMPEPEDVFDPVKMAAERMQEAWDIFWCYYGMDYEGLQIDQESEVLQSDDGRTYRKVGRFSTMSELKSATEAVFTTAFCEYNLYPLITENHLFREIDGVLGYSTQAGGIGGFYALPYTYTLKSETADRIVLSAACLGMDEQAHTFELVLVKEDGVWKLDTYYGYTSTGYTGDLPLLH